MPKVARPNILGLTPQARPPLVISQLGFFRQMSALPATLGLLNVKVFSPHPTVTNPGLSPVPAARGPLTILA